jgi:hypothetical protein
MEELIALREHIENKNYAEALLLIDEMEEMSREDKLNKIYSYAKVLLLHLIKQATENRTTRSWDASIYNAVKEIRRTNRRRKSGGCHANESDLQDILADAYDTAMKYAALEAFGGALSEAELAAKLDAAAVIDQAMEQIRQ